MTLAATEPHGKGRAPARPATQGDATTARRDTAARAVLVTGGGRGLGRALAASVAKSGFDVAITYRSDAAAAAEAVAEIQACGRHGVALCLDTGDLRSFTRFLADLRRELSKLGHSQLYGLVNTVSIGLTSLFAEPTNDVRDQLLNVHLKTAYFLSQQLLPLVQDNGRVVNVARGRGEELLPGFSVRGAAPGAVALLSGHLAVALAERRIAVDLVAAAHRAAADLSVVATSPTGPQDPMAAGLGRVIAAFYARGGGGAVHSAGPDRP